MTRRYEYYEKAGKRDRMQKSKKAMEFSVIRNVVLSLVILIILLFFVKMVVFQARNSVEKAACKQSVKHNALRLKVMGTDLTNEFGKVPPIKCPTNYITVNDINPDAIKKKIADAMFDCWDNFGRGELEIFDTEDNNYGVICSVLKFKKKGKIKGFANYLATHYVPARDETYLEFFSSKKFDGKEISVFENPKIENTDDLNLDKGLAVVFLMNKDAHVGKLGAGLWIGHNLGFLFGFGAGSATVSKNLFLVYHEPTASASSIGYDSVMVMPDEAIEAYLTEQSASATIADSAISASSAAEGFSLMQVAGKSISTIGRYVVVFAAAGTAAGFILGADHSADYDAQILLVAVDELPYLGITYLEGSASKGLFVKDFSDANKKN